MGVILYRLIKTRRVYLLYSIPKKGDCPASDSLLFLKKKNQTSYRTRVTSPFTTTSSPKPSMYLIT